LCNNKWGYGDVVSMLKRSFIFLFFVLVLVSSVYAFQQNNSEYKAIGYLGGTGDNGVNFTASGEDYRASYGIGQNIIQERQDYGTGNFVIRYGIFWINVTFTEYHPSFLFHYFNFEISEIGIDWLMAGWNDTSNVECYASLDQSEWLNFSDITYAGVIYQDQDFGRINYLSDDTFYYVRCKNTTSEYSILSARTLAGGFDKMGFVNLSIFWVFFFIGIIFVWMMHKFKEDKGSSVAYGFFAATIWILLGSMLMVGFDAVVIEGVNLPFDVNNMIGIVSFVIAIYAGWYSTTLIKQKKKEKQAFLDEQEYKPY